MPDHKKCLVSVIIPVYEEKEETLQALLRCAPKDWEVIVVDDGSKHSRVQCDIRHLYNAGYGNSLKTGMRFAKGKYILTMDGDGQHTFDDALRLFDFIRYFDLDMVVGDRRVKETSLKRFLGRKFLNWTASLVAGRWIGDLNSGLRIFKREIALGYAPILCDSFSFTTSLTMSMLCDKYRVDFLPIKVHPRTHGESHVRVIRDGLRTLKYILWIGMALRTRGIRKCLRNLTMRLRS